MNDGRARVLAHRQDALGGGFGVAEEHQGDVLVVGRSLRIIEDRVLSDGFEPLIRIAMTTDRSLFLTTLIAFDRRHKGERQAARDCHRALTAELIEAGYPPYRAGIDEMDLLDPHGSSHWAVVAALKRALDPDGVLAPGRYEPAVAAALRAPAAG